MPKTIMYPAIGIVILLIGVALTLLVVGLYSAEPEPEPELEPEISGSIEMLTISYKRPGGSDVDYDSLETVFTVTDLPEEVVLPRTSETVSQDYMTAYSAVVSDANQLETQMRVNVAAAMFEVQKEAEATNYLLMFQRILDAKEVTKVSYELTSEFSASNSSFKSIIRSDGVSGDIARSSTLLAQDADVFFTASVVLLDALEVALSGAPPSQTLVDKVDRLSEELLVAANNFSQGIIRVNTAIQQI